MKKKISILFLLRLLKTAVSVVNLSLAAKYFGVTIERDVWILALNVIIVLDVALWGPVNETFRARFVFLKEEEGETAALGRTRSLLFFTLMFSAALVTLILFFPGVVATVIAPSFSGTGHRQLIFMIMVIAPSLLINQFTQLLASILNAYHSFFIPEIAGMVSVVLNALFMILLAPVIGIYSLAIGYYAGLLLLLLLLIVQIRKKGIQLFGGRYRVRFGDFMLFFYFALPFFFPYFFGQVNLLVEKVLSGALGEGMVSVVDYGRKFSEVLFAVLSGVLITMLVPVLSAKHARGEKKEFVHEFRQIYQLGLIAVTAMITLFTACPEAFVGFLYDQGSIEPTRLKEISMLAMYYSWAGLPVFLYLVSGLTLLASGQQKKYAFYGIMAQLIMIVANYLLIHQYHMFVFPLTLTVSHTVAAIIMLSYFPHPGARVFGTLLQYMVFLVLTCFSVWVFSRLLPAYPPLPTLLIYTTLTAVFLLLYIFLCKLDERRLILSVVRKWRS